jgi:hypothetical protein
MGDGGNHGCEGDFVNKSEDNQGFIISWQEPPLTSTEWSANVTTPPMIPHRVHTMRGPNVGTGTWSGHGSALKIARWWHLPAAHVPDLALDADGLDAAAKVAGQPTELVKVDLLPVGEVALQLLDLAGEGRDALAEGDLQDGERGLAAEVADQQLDDVAVTPRP